MHLFATLEDDWRLPMSFTESMPAPAVGLHAMTAAAAALRTRSDASAMSAVSEKSAGSARHLGSGDSYIVASSRERAGAAADPRPPAERLPSGNELEPGSPDSHFGFYKPSQGLAHPAGASPDSDTPSASRCDRADMASLAALELEWPDPGSSAMHPSVGGAARSREAQLALGVAMPQATLSPAHMRAASGGASGADARSCGGAHAGGGPAGRGPESGGGTKQGCTGCVIC